MVFFKLAINCLPYLAQSIRVQKMSKSVVFLALSPSFVPLFPSFLLVVSTVDIISECPAVIVFK